MPSTPLAYRLRVRDASTQVAPNGTTDVLLVTSVPGSNPYISEAPSGDGAEVDLLSGTSRTGVYSVNVIDVPTGEDGTGTIRYVTNRLEDSTFRQQLLSRRAYVEFSDNEGASWSELQAGYVVAIRLVTAAKYQFIIGDTRRIETSRRIFSWGAAAGPTGVSERDRFPQRGCLVGGPIIGGFGPLNDTGGDEYTIPFTPETDVVSGRKFLALALVASYVPPTYRRAPAASSPAFTDMRRILLPFKEEFTSQIGVSTPLFQQLLDEDWTWYPKVTVEISNGTTTWRGQLRALIQPYVGVVLDEASSASPPTTGTNFRVRMYQEEVSDLCPLYVDMHPVDIVTGLYDTVGILWDTTTAAAVKAALGSDLRYVLRITEPRPMLDFLTRSVFGPFGFGVRTGDDGEQEFFLTRRLGSSTPTISIDVDDLVTADPVAFTLEEQSIVSSFRVKYLTLAKSNVPPDANPPPPPDGIVISENVVILENGDVSVFSTREVQFDFDGMVRLASSWAPAMGPLISAIALEGFDRFGRGAPYADFHVLRGSDAFDLRVGDEALVNVPQYPNRGYRIGESTVGPRIMQVVRRTIDGGHAKLKLVDSGVDLQPATPAATISLAINTGAPRTVAQVTITNAAAINVTGVLSVALEWATGVSSPSGNGAILERYAPGQVPTAAVSLPPVVPGSRVWVRARTEQVERRASAWTAWASITLSAFAAPTGPTLSGITAESVEVEWVPSNVSYWSEVFVAPGTTAPADWGPYKIQTFQPGSTRAVVRNLLEATDYVVGVAHRDQVTGERTTVVWDTFTTTVNAADAPTPLGIIVLDLEEDASQDTGIAIAIYAADEVFDVELQRAPDLGGSPGVWRTVAIVPGSTQIYRDLLPSNGAVWWYRIRHVLAGYDPSDYTGAQSATPGGLPLNISRPAIFPLVVVSVLPGDPDYVITWEDGSGGGGGSGIGALTGDVTAAGTGSVAATIAPDVVTYAKMQNVSAASRLLGRGDSGAGDVEELILGAGLALTGTVLNTVGGGGGGNADFLSGAITNSTNSSNSVYAAVNGSAVTVEAGKTYYIRWMLRTYSAAATTAPRPRRVLAGGAVGSVLGFHYVGQSNASAAMLQSSREGTNDPFLATGNATSTTTAAGSMIAECLFECTTGGTIGLEFLSEVNASLVTISGDGSCWVAVARTT